MVLNTNEIIKDASNNIAEYDLIILRNIFIWRINMKTIIVDELLALSKSEFIDRCKKWNESKKQEVIDRHPNEMDYSPYYGEDKLDREMRGLKKQLLILKETITNIDRHIYEIENIK